MMFLAAQGVINGMRLSQGINDMFVDSVHRYYDCR